MILKFRTSLVRTIWANRMFSLVNVLGLAVALSAVLVILSYVREELSYDKFHSKHDDIYRVTQEYKDDVKLVHSAFNHSPVCPNSGREPARHQKQGALVGGNQLPWPFFPISLFGATPHKGNRNS